ncbi:MAG: hypothetical protein GF334_04420 [Candidatus Altiarchaeales archaeon]|nr:hypothetical protein [Candidatus Altiarchaeales archaeon]
MCYDVLMDNRLVGDLLPETASDVNATAINEFLDSQFGVLQNKMVAQSAEVERLLKTEVGGQVIKAAMAEFLETARIRLALLSGLAMDTLEDVMLDDKPESKTATARVRAAETVLDRGGFPKMTQQFRVNADLSNDDQLLPSMDEVLANVPPDQVSMVMDRYKETVQMIEDLRAGGQIIDVTTEKVEPENQEEPA